jgi:hypothetical protein
VRRRASRAAGPVLLALLLATPAAAFDLPPPVAAWQASLERAWHARADGYAPPPWHRPVLRGDPIEGNAAEALEAALRDAEPLFDAVDPEWFVKSALGPDPGAPPAVRAAAEGLSPLVEAGRRTWAASPGEPADSCVHFRGDAPQRVVRFMRATHVLLASAEAPASCLRVTADVVRSIQDWMAGGSLVMRRVGDLAIRRALTRARICVDGAPPEARASAAIEFARLARDWPPLGPTVRFEALYLASGALHEVRAWVEGPLVFPGPEPVLGLAHAARLLADFDRTDPSPATRVAWLADLGARGEPWEGVRRQAVVDVETRALVGLFALSLGPAPPDLLDPFADAPFVRRAFPDGAIVLASVGMDGRAATHDPDRGDDVWVELLDGEPPLWIEDDTPGLRAGRLRIGEILEGGPYRLKPVGLFGNCEPLP